MVMNDILSVMAFVSSVGYLVYFLLNRHKRCGCSGCTCSGQFKKS